MRGEGGIGGAFCCARAYKKIANRTRGAKMRFYADPSPEVRMKTVVIAIGGNSLIKDAQHMSVPDQYAAVVETARHITDLLERRYHIVITHGNGPQVGFILLRSEHSRGILHQVPIDSIVADTQGALGYQIQQALENEFHRRGLKKSVATIVTQTLVDRNDPAFAKPSKPIGQFYTHAEAEDRMRVEKWIMVEDAGRGWRRVVASPKPVRITESEVIKHLVKDGYVVITAGGGGIPVVADEQGNLSGVAAGIDKDLASPVEAGPDERHQLWARGSRGPPAKAARALETAPRRSPPHTAPRLLKMAAFD